jgi:hypothetical protein
MAKRDFSGCGEPMITSKVHSRELKQFHPKTVLVGTKLCLGVLYRSTTDDVADFSPLTQLLLVEILKFGVSFAWWTRERQTISPGDQYVGLEDGDDRQSPRLFSPNRDGNGNGDRSASPVNSRHTYSKLSLPPIPTLIPLAGIIALNCAVGFAVCVYIYTFLAMGVLMH